MAEVRGREIHLGDYHGLGGEADVAPGKKQIANCTPLTNGPTGLQ